MNKVITINLNGVAYQLEEGGYDALRLYLDHAARRLEGNPDRNEIVADIEQAIADKFRALLGAYKTVVSVTEVAAVIAEMGPVEDSAGAGAGAGATPTEAAAATDAKTTGADAGEIPGVRRLYRIHDGSQLSGVCNGLGAYFGLDPTIFRVVFVLLSLLWGLGLVVYILLTVLIPVANSPAEKAAAQGSPSTAQEFIRRAREGYYESMKSWNDKHARRAWKRRFRDERRAWRHGFHQQMHAQARPGQTPWSSPPLLGMFLAPILSLVLLGLFVAMVYALYEAVTRGMVYGIALPAHLPLWAVVLAVLMVYVVVAWPIKAARYACYGVVHPAGWGTPWGGLFGSLVGLFFFAFGVWMLDRHVPEFHLWLTQLPDLLHRAVENVRHWFDK